MPLSTARSGLPNPLQTCTDGLDMAIQVALNPDLIGVLDFRRSRSRAGLINRTPCKT